MTINFELEALVDEGYSRDNVAEAFARVQRLLAQGKQIRDVESYLRGMLDKDYDDTLGRVGRRDYKGRFSRDVERFLKTGDRQGLHRYLGPARASLWGEA